MNTELSKNTNGFTLLEIFLAIALGGIVTIAVYQTFLSQERASVDEKQVIEVQQNLRSAMYLMESEIRMAGFDQSPGRNAMAGIVRASPGLVIFTKDILGGGTDGIDNDGDGEVDEADEVNWGNGELSEFGEGVTFGFSDADDANHDGIPNTSNGVASLRREVCNPDSNPTNTTSWTNCTGLQPLVDNVRALCFEYGVDMDGDGGIDSWITDANAVLNQIRAIRVSLLMRTRNPVFRPEEVKELSAQNLTVGAHNVPIPAKDRYRYRMMSTVIKCRNMGL